MKIAVSGILKFDGNSLDINIEDNGSMFTNKPVDINKFNSVVLKGIATNSKGLLNFKGEINLSYEAICSRCLKPMNENLVLQVEEGFYKETEENNEHNYYYSSKELDFTKFVVDNVEMAIPAKHLCSEQCEGLCTQCGCSFNDTQCVCKDEYIDPRLSKLKDFFK